MEAKKSTIEIISTTIIKPSSPTPQNKRCYKLSLLEQTFSTKYGPMLYLYTKPPERFTLHSLQKSLSKTLDNFYPFAGRLNHDLSSIDCNDQGAYFVEAKITSKLSNFLLNPDPETVPGFLPCSPPETFDKAKANGVLTLVQVTVFSCGGIAIGFQVARKITDGFSLSRFAKTWAAITAGNRSFSQPVFIGSELFPPLISPIKRIDQTAPTVLRTRRFVFGATKLANLKAKIRRDDPFNINPSSVEVLSSLLLKCVLKASGLLSGELIQMVNLRKRLARMAENYTGNFAWPVILSAAKGKNSMELHEIASIVKRGLSDYFRLCEETGLKGEALVSMVSQFAEREAELAEAGIGLYWFTSLSSFRLYETDFGWGKPAWATSPVFFPNSFGMLHSKSGHDVEIWATLEEKVMQKFERNEELLAFAYVDVSNNAITQSRM